MPIPVNFIHDLIWDDIPPDAQYMASHGLLDLTATLVAGRATQASQITYNAAAALIHQHLDPQQVLPPTIHDENILQLADRVVMQTDAELEQQFPARALARVVLRTKDGQEFSSGSKEARGDPHNPLCDTELTDKLRHLTIPINGQERADALLTACWQTDPLPDVKTLLSLMKYSAQFLRD